MKQKNFPTIIFLTILAITLITPQITSASSPLDIQITRLDGTTINLTYEQILALPQTIVYANLACYGTPITNGNWQGAKLPDILNQAGVDPYVQSIDFRAQDGYSMSMPIDTALSDDVIVAYQLDGKALGETWRLVVPGANGNIWIAMIISITMSSAPTSVSIAAGNPVSGFQIANYINTTEPSKTQIQTKPTPTPAENKNIPAAPTIPPANVTQPPSEQQQAGQKSVSVPVEVFYAGASGAFVGLAVAYFMVYRRRKLKT
jgi:DMSO/TMAO reductase YedYZ molybdopterin-dependent catalytic subunit